MYRVLSPPVNEMIKGFRGPRISDKKDVARRLSRMSHQNNRWLRGLSLTLVVMVSLAAWTIMAWLALNLWRAALT